MPGDQGRDPQPQREPRLRGLDRRRAGRRRLGRARRARVGGRERLRHRPARGRVALLPFELRAGDRADPRPVPEAAATSSASTARARTRPPSRTSSRASRTRRRSLPDERDAVISHFTSGGTTGRPKGAMWSNLIWEAWCANAYAHMPIKKPPVHLVATSMAHGAGVFAWPAMAFGGTTVCIQKAGPAGRDGGDRPPRRDPHLHAADGDLHDDRAPARARVRLFHPRLLRLWRRADVGRQGGRSHRPLRPLHDPDLRPGRVPVHHRHPHARPITWRPSPTPPSNTAC